MMPKTTKEIEAGSDGQFACPECRMGHKETLYKDRKALGRHRRFVHGILGTAHPKLAAQRAKNRSKPKKKLTVPTQRNLSVSERRRILKLRAEGNTYTEIAAEVGRSEGTVYHTLRNAPENGNGHKQKKNGASNGHSKISTREKEIRGRWTLETLVGYLYSECRSLIQITCTGSEVSVAEVTSRVSDLLHAEASRTQLGIANQMSSLPRISAA